MIHILHTGSVPNILIRLHITNSGKHEPLLLVGILSLQRGKIENSKQIFSEKELRGHSPNFHIHVSVSDLYIPRSICLFCCRKYWMWIDREYTVYIAHRHMNVDIGTEAAQFPGKKFINGIFVAVFGSWKKITSTHVYEK
jgi:hypothetical protein